MNDKPGPPMMLPENDPSSQTGFIISILSMLALGSLVFSILFIAIEGWSTDAGVLLSTTFVSAGCIWLTLRGKPMPGKILVPTMILGVQLYSMLNGYGLRANTTAGLALALVSASLLMGKRAVFIFTILSIIMVTGIGWAEMTGLFPHALATLTDFETILSASVLISLMGGALYLLMQRTEKQLKLVSKKETEHRSLLENIPSITYICGLGENAPILYITPQVEKLTGYARNAFLENPALWRSILHPEDRELVFQESNRTNRTGVPFSLDFRLITKTGSPVWVHDEAVLVRNPAGEPSHWLGVWTNINERKVAEENLNQREAILEAVAYAAERFLEVPDWRDNIAQVLKHLGRVISASHAYLFENFITPDGIASSRIVYEWTAPGYKSDINEEIYQNLPIEEDGFGYWHQLLSSGEPFVGSSLSMPAEEQEHLNERGILAILDVPIYVNSRWWGTIGFDEMSKQREWTISEVDALKVAAKIISAAVQRHEADVERQQTEQVYRQAIESTGAVPYYEDYASNTYPFMGEGIHQLTGYNPNEITPSLWLEIAQESIVISEGTDLQLPEAMKLAREGKIKIWKCDFHIRRRDGQMRWVADTAVEIIGETGASQGSVGILLDVTDRRQMEERIRHLNYELEQRVKDRTAQLEATNKELEAFSYSVSHDLRAPLRAVRGYSQIIANEFGQQIPEEARDMLTKVSQAAQQMSELIESLLALSRLTRGNLNRRELDLSRIAANVLDNLQLHESERPVTCLVAKGLNAYADERLMTTVLENLLGNAWKYTSKTENPVIEFGMLNEDGKTIYYVQDNGAGFNMQYAGKLFGAFQRLHTDNEFPGHGVGLATVQRILNRHGGQIWAKAEIGKGATFYFTLG